jgi:hypothetical protein
MSKRSLIPFLGLSAAIVLGAAAPAAGYGWGGRDNPDWNGTATGVAAGRCSPMTNRSLAGTLVGDDGLGLNATIGFNMIDDKGRNIDLATGCPVYGYGTIVQLNHYVGDQGQRLGSTQHDARGAARGPVTAGWRLDHLPASARVVWIETYTRSYTGSPCGMRCAGTAGVRKYGWVNRRQVPVTAGPVHLVAPRTAAFGGSTGTIEARLVDRAGRVQDPVGCAAPAITRRCVQVHTWSMNSPEGARIQGWGAGTRFAPGRWRFAGLAPAQRYKIRLDFIDAAGRLSRRVQAYTVVHARYTSRLSIRL